MGEYATYNGQQIKIGTCEDMYYLRADQAHLVTKESGSLDPMDRKAQAVIRFRFPWPDEDHIKPGGGFHDANYERKVGLYGIAAPATLEHYSVQFTSHAGYVMSIPCPEGPPAAHGLTVHRNGFAGPVRIVQQGYRNGHLALICECGGCGAKYNLPTLADAEPVIVACRAQADAEERRNGNAKWWHAVADRIAAGYAINSPGNE